MTARRVLLTVLVAAAAVDAPSAQQTTGAARPSLIQGVILADDTGLPLANASVRVYGSTAPRTLTADEEGRFSSGELAPGAYFVTAASNGYVVGASGQRTPGDRPSQITVSAGTVYDVNIRLTPFGTIAGRIVDEAGRPAAKVAVYAQRHPMTQAYCRTFRQERNVTLENCQTMTDANGDYVLRRVPNGNYHVIAIAPIATATVPSSAVLPGTPAAVGMHAYYPGTALPEQATTVAVQAGTQAHASFVLVRSTLSRLAGRVVDASGAPARDTLVVLNPRAPNLQRPLPNMVELDATGAFEFTNVSPGEYDIAARSTAPFIGIAQRGGGGWKGITGARATVRVRVPGEELDQIALQMRRGFEVSGILSTGAGRVPRQKGAPVVSASPATMASSFDAMNAVGELVTEEDRFRLSDIVGPHLFSVERLPPGLMVRRIQADGVDVTDTGIDVTHNVSLEIAIGPQTELSGRVTTRRGADVPGMSVVVFAQEPQRWTLPRTRYVRAVAAGVNGTFAVHALPAGSYFVVATPAQVDVSAATPVAPDPGAVVVENLDLLIPHAVRLDLKDGERRTLTLVID
jgi:hypothetical protein